MLELTFLHIDPDFLVVDKPGGLLAVPGRGPDKQDCVVSRVKALYPDCIKQPAVHRLDMYTSGIMILARSKEAHRRLSIQFEQRLVKKEYTALLDGLLDHDKGLIELPFRLDTDNRPLQIYDPIHGKTGITRWRKLSENRKTTRVLFLPLTGRTHQLRVHAAHPLGLGVPIVGDTLYGRGKEGGQMFLHASFLSVLHPFSEQNMDFSSEPSF